MKNVGECIHLKLDFVGVLLSTVGFGTLLYAFSRAGAIGTALLVTILTKQAQFHAIKLTTDGSIADQGQLLLKASIEGMNDAYRVVIVFGVIGLIMSFFIKKTKQENAA